MTENSRLSRFNTDLFMIFRRAERELATRVVSKTGDLAHEILTELVAGAVGVGATLYSLAAELRVAVVT